MRNLTQVMLKALLLRPRRNIIMLQVDITLQVIFHNPSLLARTRFSRNLPQWRPRRPTTSTSTIDILHLLLA